MTTLTSAPAMPLTLKLRAQELRALAATVLMTAFGLSLVDNRPIPLIVAALILGAQGLRGLSRPLFRRSLLGPLCVLSAVFAIAQGLTRGPGESAISHAIFLLGVQLAVLTSEHDRRHEGQVLVIDIIVLGLTSFLVVDAIFGFYFLTFIATMASALSARRVARRAEEYMRPDARPAVDEGPRFGSTVLLTISLLLGAGLIFFTIPRTPSNLLSIPNRGGTRQIGFGSQVSLNDMGRLRRNLTVVARVEIERGVPSPLAYFRGCTFDIYSGGRWFQDLPDTFARIQPNPPGSYELGAAGITVEREDRYRFYLEPMDTDARFTP